MSFEQFLSQAKEWASQPLIPPDLDPPYGMEYGSWQMLENSEYAKDDWLERMSTDPTPELFNSPEDLYNRWVKEAERMQELLEQHREAHDIEPEM